MRRGRPRHDDVLTPREWQVLDLLREGLTNEQIAVRLDISRDTAKFHVSEILTKLGVESRVEAAAWRGRPKALPVFAPLLALRTRLAAAGAEKAAAIGGLTLAAVALLALLVGVVVMDQRRSPEAVAPPTSTPGIAETPAPPARTGDPALDSLIEALITEDEAGLQARFGDIDVYESDGPPEPWTARLASGERSLYAVRTPWRQAPALTPLDYEIIVATPGDFEPLGWLFGVIDGGVVRVYPPSGQYARHMLYDFEQLYDGYLVLPPVEDLPKPPSGHSLAVRTGDPGADGLLTLVQANDIDALLDAVEYRQEPCAGPLQSLFACRDPGAGTVEVLPIAASTTLCSAEMSLQDAAYVERWLRAWGDPVAIHAVPTIARDYQVTEGLPIGADHEIMVVTQQDRYTWQIASLYERDGRIVAIGCRPFLQYPQPREIPFIVPPPPGDALPELSRRSGVGVVDAMLDALQSSDADAWIALIDTEPVGCVAQAVYGSPPECRAGESPGTQVEVLTLVQCEGGYVRLDDYRDVIAAGRSSLLDDSDWRLHALLETPRPRHAFAVVLVSSAEDLVPGGGTVPRTARVMLSAQGVTLMATGCWRSPEQRIEGVASPTFLLPPP